MAIAESPYLASMLEQLRVADEGAFLRLINPLAIQYADADFLRRFAAVSDLVIKVETRTTDHQHGLKICEYRWDLAAIDGSNTEQMRFVLQLVPAGCCSQPVYLLPTSEPNNLIRYHTCRGSGAIVKQSLNKPDRPSGDICLEHLGVMVPDGYIQAGQLATFIPSADEDMVVLSYFPSGYMDRVPVLPMELNFSVPALPTERLAVPSLYWNSVLGCMSGNSVTT